VVGKQEVSQKRAWETSVEISHKRTSGADDLRLTRNTFEIRLQSGCEFVIAVLSCPEVMLVWALLRQ
jgi:hypothetical protein